MDHPEGLQVLFAASEVYPLVKTGGLADVAGFLPAELHDMGYDIRIILPAYHSVLELGLSMETVSTFIPPGEKEAVTLLETRLPGTAVPVYLLDVQQLFNRPGGPYQDDNGLDWPDNMQRFACLCRVLHGICMNSAGLQWQPQILHCNDWHTGLAPALLSQEGSRPATVFSVHNLAYQGVFSADAFDLLRLPDHFRTYEALEFHGGLSFIKGGLVYADRLTTVSPAYAREITTPDFGAGLDGLFRNRKDDLTGILNGVNYNVWDPHHDTLIYQTYAKSDVVRGKTANKTALQNETGLTPDEDTCLLGFVGRLTEQKGIDIIIEQASGFLADPDVQLVMLGNGNPVYEDRLRGLMNTYPGRMAINNHYSETLAHRIQAASDILLMPSRFEPCGLTQLYALRYGTLPVVSNTGGLLDTVVDTSPATLQQGNATGFHFISGNSGDFSRTLARAVDLFRKQPHTWRAIMQNAMSQEFSWNTSAKEYGLVYGAALESVKNDSHDNIAET